MHDLAILGAGPAGYVAAEHAGKMGRKVLLVEKDTLGGVCLNRGCIPTKSFLYSAKLYAHTLYGESFGVTVEDARLDYDVVRARTAKVQETLRNGIGMMMKKHKIDVVQGSGVVKDRNTVTVDGKDYHAKNLLICTGSSPVLPPIPGLRDNPCAVDSTGILNAEKLADHLIIIGGGVIGIEFACFYSLADKHVTVVEMLPQICGATDAEMAKTLERKLQADGVDIFTGAKVSKIKKSTVFFTDKEGKEHLIGADLILAATGRAANLQGMGFESLNLAMDKRCIKVNERAETSVPGVYAAGDVTGRLQLAHFASRQGIVAVNNMFGVPDVCREDAIPAVIYTDPEVASVGLTEEQARAKGIKCRTLKAPMGLSGRFLAETDGTERAFVKTVLGECDEVIGMHVVGPYASEMIGAAAVMIEAELRASDVSQVVFPHPTVAEVMKEIMFM